MSLRWTILLVGLGLSACSDISPPAVPGPVTAALLSPHGAEGAALLHLFGAGVLEVTAVGDTEVYADVSGETTRIVLINQVGGTLSFRVALADLSRPPLAVIREVSGPDDELRPDPARYRLEFAP